MGGDYEDHVSGLPEFLLFWISMALLSYAALVVDLIVWGIRRLAPQS
jgi:hypothetical protein